MAESGISLAFQAIERMKRSDKFIEVFENGDPSYLLDFISKEIEAEVNLVSDVNKKTKKKGKTSLSASDLKEEFLKALEFNLRQAVNNPCCKNIEISIDETQIDNITDPDSQLSSIIQIQSNLNNSRVGGDIVVLFSHYLEGKLYSHIKQCLNLDDDQTQKWTTEHMKIGKTTFASKIRFFGIMSRYVCILMIILTLIL